jgi:N-acetylglucosaminyl-diphospho-decaprenol L-rhamnosyltransferase
MPDPGHPAVDAVIVTWNSGPDLGACLAALSPSARAIVIDNASGDDSVAVARAGGAEVVPLDRNSGFAAAVNVGLQRVRAPLTLLLNPDVVVDPGTVDQCAAVLGADPSIGIAGAATRLPDGRPEPPAARHDRRAVHVLVESLGLVHLSRRFDLQMVHDRTHDRDVDAVNGAFLLIRTDLLRRLGGLDDTVFLYLEDQDLCRRVRDDGSRVRFLAGAGAVHGAGTSTARGDAGAQVRAYLHRIDADVEFLRRYGSRGEAGLAVLAYVVRSLAGLVVSVVRPERRSRYAASLRYSLRQRRGRQPAPAV